MTVYISGSIGMNNPTAAIKEKFAKIEAELREWGVEVFNPTKSGYGKYADRLTEKNLELGVTTTWYSEILKLDIAALSFCQAIFMLKDWMDSPGARAEHAFAQAIGLQVIYQDTPINIPIRDLVTEMVEAGERANAGKCVAKYERILHRDWDLIVTVRRHKEKKGGKA